MTERECILAAFYSAGLLGPTTLIPTDPEIEYAREILRRICPDGAYGRACVVMLARELMSAVVLDGYHLFGRKARS